MLLLINLRLLAVAGDTHSIDQKILRAYHLQNHNLDSSFILANEVLMESKQTNYEAGIASAFMRLGSIYNAKGKNDSALFYLRKAKNIRVKLQNFSGAANVCFVMNYVYRQQSQIDSSFQILFESLRLSETAKDSAGLISAYNGLGDLQSEYSSPLKAFEYYEKAKNLGEASQYYEGLATSYNGMGNYYFIIDRYDLALQNFLLADSLFQIIGDVFNLGICANNIANCYDQKENFPKAYHFYKKAFRQYHYLEYDKGKASILLNLGILFENVGLYDSAISYYQRVIPISIRIEDLNLKANAFEQLAKSYSLMGNHQLAFFYQKKFSQLKDTLINKDKVASISEMQTKYETEKKEQKIELLAEKNKTSLAERNALFAGGLLLLMGLFIALYAYYQRRKNALKDAQLAREKINVLINEQELKAVNALIKGQEEERQRIATDLHDRTGSMLSTVKLLFSALSEKIQEAPKETLEQYQKASNLLDESCEEIRRVSHNLSTGLVSSLGLKFALEEFCDSINSIGTLKCSCQMYGLDQRLGGEMEIGIYRIIQESVNNSLKHAKAQNISIQINGLENEFNVIIEDDGIGFEIEKIQKQGSGIGLHNLNLRAEKLGGSYTIDSKLGRGTTVIIEMPL